MPADTKDPAPTFYPLSRFKEALAEYQACRAEFETCGKDPYSARGSDTWNKRDTARKIAAEGLWVSGVAALFNLLETNYNAQERIVEAQLKLAAEQTASAKSMATSTKWLVIVTCLLIVITGVVGLCGPIFAKATSPVDARQATPGLIAPAQAPVPTPADRRLLLSPTRDR
jgi:hypothetical protein